MQCGKADVAKGGLNAPLSPQNDKTNR